jgi:hypothetical protein
MYTFADNSHPPGKARAARPGATPDDLYHNAIGNFTNAIDLLEQAFTAIGQALGNDGRPLVEDRGVDTQQCTAWRETLTHIDDELGYWSRRFKQAHGSKQILHEVGLPRRMTRTRTPTTSGTTHRK